MPARFIVLEGPDGSGTSYHCRTLATNIDREGRAVLLTSEPTDGPVGSWIRALLREGEAPLPPSALQLLFTADRAWHCEHVITPALRVGTEVICDRFTPSTLIYGSAQGLPVSWLESLNKNFIQPDRMFLLLPPLTVCRERIARREQRDFFEERELQERIYEGYETFARAHPECLRVDTSGSKEEGSKQILALL